MKHGNKGFTLVELIVVLAIIAILAAVAVPQFDGYITAAKKSGAILECRNAVTAAQALYTENYDNPDSVTPADIKAMANVSGEVSGIELYRSEPVHLTYITDEWDVAYCRDFETCSLHSELYSIYPAGTSPGTGGGDEGGEATPAPTEPAGYEGYFYIGGDPNYRVTAIGDLEVMDFGPYGQLIIEGSVVYWQGDYYYTRQNQYLRNTNDRAAYIGTYGVKIKKSGFTTPGAWTQPGDLKLQNGQVYIFFPYSRFQNDYADENYWFPVNIG
jgi:prepilin-type N-terminal cleavage/methylation domain-containing protein